MVLYESFLRHKDKGRQKSLPETPLLLLLLLPLLKKSFDNSTW